MPSARAERPNAWKAFWRGVAKFQTSKINWQMALRNAIGVATPLAAGAAVGELGAGLIMSTGALQVAFRDSSDPYQDRARFMFGASVIAGFAVMLGSLSGHSQAGAVVLATLWAFASGMLVALGQPAGDLGLMSLVLLLVYGAVPMAPERAALSGLAAFAGGLLQTALSVAMWPIDAYAPVRRAVGDVYLAIAREAAVPVKGTESPLATAQSIAAQKALQALDADRTAQCDRLRFVAIQAERLRLSLLALMRVRLRLDRDYHAAQEYETVDRFLAEVSRVAAAIGYALRLANPPAVAAEDTEKLDAMADLLRGGAGDATLAGMLNDARIQMDAIAGQLRAGVRALEERDDLSSTPVPAKTAPANAAMARHLVRERVLTLRANLSLESAAFRHALRLAVCIAIADTIARSAGGLRPYWLPMTAAIVLRPDFGTTFSRGVLRLIGTFAGIVLATGLIHVFPDAIWTHITMVALLMFAVRSLGAANYGVFATAVTAMIVFLVWLNGVAPQPVMAARAMNTAVGGGIALAAYWLWPTWERHQVSETMARMLAALGTYLNALRDNYVSRSAGAGRGRESARFANEKLERARIAGRLARSNFEASVERAVAEPGVSRETVRMLTAMVASSHRLVQALMALEAVIAAGEHVPPRVAFHRFTDDVMGTLALLANALRGKPAHAGELPDLREDHHALVGSGPTAGQGVELYGLVNIETDRMTNALNTLAGEVLEWVSWR